jgi:putative phage-type endonuclease
MHPVVAKLIDREYAEQRSEEWLSLRGNMLTASDAATAIGVNVYEKPNDLILKKCGLNKFEGNEATVHGNKYENVARDIYCERYGEVAHEIGLYPHPVHKWLGGSPDGITESGKLLEIKCPLRRKITPEVPVHYMPQLQLLMEILDLEECDFIQYKPDELTWPNPPEFMVTNVKRSRDWFEANLPVMDAFWKRVIWHREHGVEELLQKTKKKASVPRKKVIEKEQCKIVDYEDDDPNVFSSE